MRRTPLLTLLAGALLAAVLVVLSSNASTKDASRKTEAAEPTAAASAAASPSPSPSPSPAPKVNAVWAGDVTGGGASLAISSTEGVAVAYLCDGKRAEAWLLGTAAEGVLNLAGKNGSTLTGTFGGGKATGSVTAGGKTWTFTLNAVAPPSGLYRAAANVRGAKVVGGWIVLPDGRQVGVVSTNDAPAAAPPISVPDGSVTIDGTALTARPAKPEDLS